MDARTVVSQHTPAGRGAIATVFVQGPQSASAVAARFLPLGSHHPGQLAIGRIYVGVWRSAATEPGEELVVCRVSEHQFEIHCHGGRAAIDSILQSLVRSGCQHRTWVDAAVPGQPGWQHRAQQTLANASTERSALILLDQYCGAFDQAIGELVELLQARSEAESLKRIDQLLRWARFGLHLTTPWQLAVTGPPNVGKSSLINAIVGYQRAVVFDQPGTTRDVVKVDTAVHGWPIQLSDTAGLRDSDDPLEKIGIERAKSHCRSSDLIVFVLSLEDQISIHEHPYGKDLSSGLVVYNKCDVTDWRPDRCDDQQTVFTSATSGVGVGQLIDRLAQAVVPEAPRPGSPVPYEQQQVDALLAARQAVTQTQTSAACELLAAVRR